jgi:hypothetical protein
MDTVIRTFAPNGGVEGSGYPGVRRNYSPVTLKP